MSTDTTHTKVFLGTTPSGKTIHWFAGSNPNAYPLCGQQRGTRGNGHAKTVYGATDPTCQCCKTMRAQTAG